MLVNGPFLCRALAFCAAVLSVALVILEGLFLSFGLIAGVRDIAIVVVVVDKKKWREQRDDC